MNRLAFVLVPFVVVLMSACVAVAPVVQGKVVAVERGGGVVRVQNEEAPGAEPLVVDITTAEIGVTPRIGDVVRIVYRAGARSSQALRVMNLTRYEGGQ